MTSSINGKWRLRVINKFLGSFQVERRGTTTFFSKISQEQ